MRKFAALVMAAVLSVSVLAGCGSKPQQETTAPAVSLEGTMEELLNKVIAENPVEFMGGVIPVDLTDTSEDGLWALKNFTGLDSPEAITEAAVYEPMMGSMAFSLVMVRTAQGSDPKAVAESMKAGIDTRKWICVEANDVLAAGYGDVVMFIMLDNGMGLTAQSFVDAFRTVAGGELDFTI